MFSLTSARAARVGAGLLALVALVATGCSSSGSGTSKGSSSPSAVSSSTGGATSSSASATKSSTPPAPPPKLVHVSGYPDGSTVGVGMPIIATFNRRITDGVQFAKNTKVTVNGKPVTDGGWYFENSDPKSGHRMEAHFRMQDYWPAHAHVHVTFSLRNVSAGKGLAFDGKLTSLDFDTGAQNIAIVDNVQHEMTIYSDGQKYDTVPVSLGATNTPTFRGIKVIMEKVPTTCMHDTAGSYYECGIKWDQRLTYSGEYLHSAPWNVHNIGSFNSSNGCTNLLPSDAVKLYNFLRIGDVVKYPNADGPAMTMGAGYGDWNVPWVQWQTGGAVSVS